MGKALRGTLFILMRDAGEGEGDYSNIASLRSCSLSAKTAMLPALHPDAYGWDHFIPGTQGWQASSDFLELVDETTILRLEYLSILEAAYFNKTLLDFVFEGMSGVQYASQGYINTWEVGGSDEAGYSGRFGVQGVTELTPTEPNGPCGQEEESGGQGDTTTTHYLGVIAGWVRLDYSMFTIEDQAELIYDGEIVAQTAGLVSGDGSLYWYYPATPGLPRSIDVRMYAPSMGTQWEYLLNCPDESNEPPGGYDPLPEGEGEGEGEGE